MKKLIFPDEMYLWVIRYRKQGEKKIRTIKMLGISNDELEIRRQVDDIRQTDSPDDIWEILSINMIE